MRRPHLTFKLKHLVDYDNFGFFKCGFTIVNHSKSNVTKNNYFDSLLKTSLLSHLPSSYRNSLYPFTKIHFI